MANLQEKITWEPGIYQLETSDPVLAGPDGVDNVQGKQLANRTAYLKKQIDDLVSGALVAEFADRLKTPRNIAMTGDGNWNVMFDGSGNASAAMTLRDSGVAPGEYGIVTVDGKGRVTKARQMSGDDVPAHDWSKVASGKPTTLAGYGITDVLTRDQCRSAGLFADLSTTNKWTGSLDQIVQPGEYYYGDGCSNAPSKFGLLKCWRENGDVVYQIAHSSDNNIYTRYRPLGGVFVPWRQLAGMDFIEKILINKADKASTLAGYGIGDAASKGDLQSAISGLVANAPVNLNTLQELAGAVNNDPKYFDTVSARLSGKADKATTLVGYGISDAASKVDLKTVVDGVNSKKADKASTLDGYGITNGVAQADIGSLAVNFNASMLKMSSGSNALPISMGTGNPELFWKKFDVAFTPVQSNELPEKRQPLVRELLQYIGSDVRYFSMGFNIMELTVKDPSIQMDFDFFIPYRHVKSGAGHSVIIYHKLLGKGDWTWLDNDARGSWNQATRYVSSTAGGDYTHVDLKVVNPEVGSKLYLALPQIVIGKWDPKRRAPQFFNIYDIVQDMVPTATPSAYA